MKIDAQVMEALELLQRERGVPVETILDALANALVSAYKRSPGAAEEARVIIDSGSGDIIVYAQELDEDGNVIKEWEDTPEDFGRIAAQTAKQVIAQRLREAKRDQVFDIYEGREGDLVTGIIQQVDYRPWGRGSVATRFRADSLRTTRTRQSCEGVRSGGPQ